MRRIGAVPAPASGRSGRKQQFSTVELTLGREVGTSLYEPTGPFAVLVGPGALRCFPSSGFSAAALLA